MKHRILATAAAFAAVALLAWIAGAPAEMHSVLRARPSTDSSVVAKTAPFPFVDRGPRSREALAAVRNRARSGVLEGAEPDGAWICAGRGSLMPDRRVRQRMDWYGNQLGILSVEDLAAVMAAEAVEACGSGADLAARAVWQSYQNAIASGVTPAGKVDKAAIARALAAASVARRRAMGEAWGEAFFGEEERALAARLASSEPIVANPAPLPDADARVAAVRDEWALWQKRVTEARAEAAAIRNDSTLSDSERSARIKNMIDRSFLPHEKVRAEALLGAG